VTKKLDHKTINEVVGGELQIVTAETLVNWFKREIELRLYAILEHADQLQVTCRLQEGIDGGWAETLGGAK
jgi:6-pyruvoyl-tetrahydropterin synthase